ncbi:DNA recombination protein RmuC [Candidatus Saccharibacteria bacterium]|nr:DNA recombination protein RmuC [Candidatus Saccharibacteria bacterium]
MEIVMIILGAVIILLLLVLIFKKSSNSKDYDEAFKKLDERMIRIEAATDKLAPKIEGEFRENRKEIAENLQNVQKTVDTRVKTLQEENTKKLEEMRETVDEKLKASVEKRFNESFKSISTQLTQVYQGLGEMKNLATGVGDLKKVMEGVKTRGIYGEVQLGSIISDILTKNQYEENIATKKGSSDRVEFAVKMPGKTDETVFLPIDSKFPVENYSRLIAAYDEGSKEEIEKYRKALSADVKEQAKKISTKYIDPPATTAFAMMFVPTESLYAEILRIPGLSDEIRQKYNISIASPSTLPVVLSGLLMGFRTVAIEQRSSEVWQVLGAVKTQFGKFGDLLDATKKKLMESANKIDSAAVTSRQIERKLKNVESLPEEDSIKMIGEV